MVLIDVIKVGCFLGLFVFVWNVDFVDQKWCWEFDDWNWNEFFVVVVFVDDFVDELVVIGILEFECLGVGCFMGLFGIIIVYVLQGSWVVVGVDNEDFVLYVFGDNGFRCCYCWFVLWVLDCIQFVVIMGELVIYDVLGFFIEVVILDDV